MIVIGLGHKARRGKDTAAKAIIEARKDRYDVRRYAFADVLKNEVRRAYELAGGWQKLWDLLRVLEDLPDWVIPDASPDMSDPLCPYGKHRLLLQWWGTEFRRSRDPFYWVKKLDAVLEDEKPQIAVITDMRFFNEAEWVKQDSNERSGFTVRLERQGFGDVGKTGHASESQLDNYDYDYTITVEDGDVESLKQMAIRVFDMIVESMKQDLPDFSLSALEQELEHAQEQEPDAGQYDFRAPEQEVRG